jgi:hypothetical protein
MIPMIPITSQVGPRPLRWVDTIVVFCFCYSCRRWIWRLVHVIEYVRVGIVVISGGMLLLP